MKKKILVVSQNYYPEQFRINDITQELVKLGHNVTVLTGLPNYPGGKIYDGYKDKSKRHEVINGVKVIRCYERERKSGGALNLFLNYYSFVCSSKRMVNKLDKDFDCVIVNQTSPVMQAKAAIKYKKKYHCPLIIYCLDLWPASLVAGGVKSGNPIYKLYHKVSRNIYWKADKILTTSKMFGDYLTGNFGITKNMITYLPQYSEDMFGNIQPQKRKDKDINLVFAGNVGKMQSVQTIIKAAKLVTNPKVKFHIVGGGSEYENCVELAKDCKNVTFYGQRPLEEMPKFYAMADAMLVTLKQDDLVSKTLPGKVQTYMSAAKPIIACGENELKNTIEKAKCGYVAKPDDEQDLAKCITKFVECKDKQKFATNSKNYYLKNFTKDKFFKTLLKEIQEIK